MIISFSFSNFKSFDKKQELTFLVPKYASRKLTQKLYQNIQSKFS